MKISCIIRAKLLKNIKLDKITTLMFYTYFASMFTEAQLSMLSCSCWPLSLIHSRHRTAQLAPDTQMVHISCWKMEIRKCDFSSIYQA